jgi:hypothetical protein
VIELHNGVKATWPAGCGKLSWQRSGGFLKAQLPAFSRRLREFMGMEIFGASDAKIHLQLRFVALAEAKETHAREGRRIGGYG